MANYWYGYRMTYLAAEQLAFRPWPRIRGWIDGDPELYRGYIERFEAADRYAKVFNLSESYGETDLDSRHFAWFQQRVRSGDERIEASFVVPVVWQDNATFGDFWVYIARRRAHAHEALEPVSVEVEDRCQRIARVLDELKLSVGYINWWPYGEQLARDTQHRLTLRPWNYEQRDHRALFRYGAADRLPSGIPAIPAWVAGDMAYVFIDGDGNDQVMRQRARQWARQKRLVVVNRLVQPGFEVWAVRWRR
jgi:hypothetical protein